MKNKSLAIVGVWAALVVGFTTGCASGGFKLTRKYAGFVNRQHIILRIVLYILTSVVYGVTMLIDLLIFNTMDFWEGRVSQGTYQFEKDGQKYYVHHRYLPDGNLRESSIEVMGKNNEVAQKIILRETTTSEIEMIVDGELRAKVSDISLIPRLSLYEKGREFDSRPLWSDRLVATN